MPDPIVAVLQGRLDLVRIPLGGREYPLVEYLGLPAEARGDDEADIVDMRLARALLEVLGYKDSDWEYNRNKERGRPDYLGRLEQIAHTVRTASLCGLGRTAPNPVLTTLRYFRDEYDAHVVDRRCPAGACPALR